MKLDIRQPMGCLFLILGAILLVFGAISDPAIYRAHSLGLNINLIWGGCFAVFGAAMLWLARKGRSPASPRSDSPENRASTATDLR